MDSVFCPKGNKGISDEKNVGDTMVKLFLSRRKFLADVEQAKSKNPSSITSKEVTNYTEEEIDKLLNPFESIFKTVDNNLKYQKALYDEKEKTQSNKPSTSTSTLNPGAGNDLSKKEEKELKIPKPKLKKNEEAPTKRRVTRGSVASRKALTKPVCADEKLGAPKQWLEDQREIYKNGLGLTNAEFDRLRNAVKVSESDSIIVKPVEERGSWPIPNPGPVPPEAREKLKSLALLEYSNFASEDKKFFGKTANEFDRMLYGQEIQTDVLRTSSNKMVRMKESLKKDRNPKLIAQDEFIITLKFYHSFKDEIPLENVNLEPTHLYEIQALGSQTLQDLRELFRCEYDYTCIKSFDNPNEYLDNPDKDQFYAMNKFKSALLCIGKKLYIDPSVEKSRIHAEHIIKWANDANNIKNIGPFEIGDSSKTLIKDLDLRYGYPYVFIHFGTCEHLVVFTSCRLATIEDPIEKKSYPRRIAAGAFRTNNTKCNVDNKITAKWIVKGYNEFPLPQMMICDDCLKTFCFNERWRKRGRFELYPIVTPKL